MNDAVMPTYGRLDVAFTHGEGSWLVDDKGNRYLDGLSGLGVVALGHANPVVAKAISDQAGQLLHTSNLYRIPAQEKLAAELAELSGMANMFFCNSGAEANECAIKICRIYGNNRGIDDPTIIVADNSFHGRTMATLTATGNPKVHAGFTPLLTGFIHVRFNDIEAVQAAISANDNVVGVMVEPIQGEGGIHIPDDDYLPALRQICDDNDLLLVVDEVQSGNARTGRYFAYQHSDIIPDVVPTAKGLANGVPIGVCLARGVAADQLKPGNHGSTFGGNPLSCAAAIAVVGEIKANNLEARAAELGERMIAVFRERLGGRNNVKDIRGKGLMLAVELTSPCTDIVQKAMDLGLLLNVTADSVVRLLPPLTITDEEADRICDVVCTLVEEQP
ncbi:MAG: aspartate aminotransferase family protein [Gammaproteobacteria bacterium]|nr:aspartate aminotransferase family protein [Gammaproteobacteria bacterium]RPG26086.1 MAG: aspartate aminotransferase family protein [Gammaproteobacteria bacterium TMED50]